MRLAQEEARQERFPGGGASPLGAQLTLWARAGGRGFASPESAAAATRSVAAGGLRETLVVRRPLNRETGVRSAFVGRDVVNDGSDSDEALMAGTGAHSKAVRLAALLSSGRGSAGDEPLGEGLPEGSRVDRGVVTLPWPRRPGGLGTAESGGIPVPFALSLDADEADADAIAPAVAFGSGDAGSGSSSSSSSVGTGIGGGGRSAGACGDPSEAHAGSSPRCWWVNLTDWTCHCIGLRVAGRSDSFAEPLGVWRGGSDLPSDAEAGAAAAEAGMEAAAAVADQADEGEDEVDNDSDGNDADGAGDRIATAPSSGKVGPSSSGPAAGRGPGPRPRSNAGEEASLEVDWGRGHGGGATAARVRVSVEELVLQEYASRGGWRGVHDEGSLGRAVCALLAWDVVFDEEGPVGVFASPFQDAPLDLDSSPAFYEARRGKIEALVRAVAGCSQADLVAWVGSAFAKARGKLCRGMQWGPREWPVAMLQLFAVCVGGRALAQMVDSLMWDHKQRSGGLPDLFVWRVLAPGGGVQEPVAAAASGGARPSLALQCSVAGAAAGLDGSSPTHGWLRLVAGARYECRWVEVKGPRDRLSDKQRYWLRILLAGGCRVDLCRVQEPARQGGKRFKRQHAEGGAATARL